MPNHPMNRASDQSKVAKARSFVNDWGWALSLVVAVLLMFGFSYRTPKDEIRDMKLDISQLKIVTQSQAADISTIVRLQCFNEAYTTKQLNLVGIRCDGIRP